MKNGFANVILLAARELRSLFASPVAYVVGAVFLLLSGFFFSIILVSATGGELTLRYAVQNMTIVLLFLSPMITMRTFTEEKKQGTFEMLMTSPVQSGQLVLGKYLGVFLFHVLLLGVTLEYWIILEILGEPDRGPIMTAYLGLILTAALFSAVGIFASSLTENQLVAVALSFGILLLLWVLRWAENIGGVFGKYISHLSISAHYDGFEKGVLDTADLSYFALFIFAFLFLTARIIESRRWSG